MRVLLADLANRRRESPGEAQPGDSRRRFAKKLSRVMIFAAMALIGWHAAAQEKKADEHRKGTVTGIVSAKGTNWIEVTADGEEKGRRYVPHWKGGAPAEGGGPDKEMLAKIKATPLKSRVRIEWEFEERARVIKIEVLKKPAAGGNDGSAKETRSGSISGEIKSKKEQNKNIVIEVLAPGEEKARSYFVQYDPKLKAPIPEVLKAVAAANVGDKVVFDWEATGHGPAIVKFKVAGKDKK